jgi:hypothetical protein
MIKVPVGPVKKILVLTVVRFWRVVILKKNDNNTSMDVAIFVYNHRVTKSTNTFETPYMRQPTYLTVVHRIVIFIVLKLFSLVLT